MPLIEWTAALETGHPMMDKDHRELVELLNQFDAESRADRIIEAARLSQMVIKAAEHFSREELLMAAAADENMVRHIKEHSSLLQELRDRTHEFRAKETEVHIVSQFLRDWLLQHIAGSDRKLAAALALWDIARSRR